MTIAQVTRANDFHVAAGELRVVTLKLNWKHQFQFAGYYAALAKGFYRDRGLDVRIEEASAYDEPVAAVLSGQADFGIGSSELALVRANGAPVVVLASIFQHSPLVILFKRDNNIDHVHDLVGKRVMLEPQSYEILAYLNNEGISSDQFILFPHSFSPDPLINDEIDAMSAYITDEPFLLSQENIPFQVISPRIGGIDFYGDSLFTTETNISADPGMVQAFREASLQGWDYAFAHEDEIIGLILAEYSQRHSQEHLEYEAQKMRTLIMPEIVAVGYINPIRWQRIAEVFVHLGMTSQEIDVKDFVYNDTPVARVNLRWTYMFSSGVIVIILLMLLIGISQGIQVFYTRCKSIFKK